MKRRVVLAFLMTLLPVFLMAGDFEDGLAASDSGDNKRAVELFLKAANQGHARAQLVLGLLYDEGKGVAQDYKEALKWYLKAAEQGSALAQISLGEMYDNAQKGTQDYREAFKWYRKAAEQGNAEAQYTLAKRYRNGLGAPRNLAEGMKWYIKAAENGHAIAQYNVGAMYSTGGEGFTQDFVQAHMWLNLAYSNGDNIAKEKRDEVAAKMTPTQIGEAQRLAREKAAEIEKWRGQKR